MAATLLMIPPQTPATREWAKRIAAAQPNLSVIVAENESDAAGAIARADAAFGTVSPALLRAASRLRWIQAPQAAPPAGWDTPELIAHPALVTNFREIFNDHIGAHIMAFIVAFARGLHRYLPQQLNREWRPAPLDTGVIQRRGHRAASDDTILAWAAARSCSDAIRVLDLGSGKGTLAMLLLQRLPRCHAIGVEALPESHELAGRNARLNGLTDRWVQWLGDLRDPSVLAGEEPFDLVTGAPPFMPVGSGVMPDDSQRAAGRFELRGGVREYVMAAAAHLAPHGKVVLLMDGLEASRTRTEQALASSGLFLDAVLTVHALPDRKPSYTRDPPAIG